MTKLSDLNPIEEIKNLKVRREQLERAEEGFRAAIEEQLDALEETATKWGHTFLVAAGTALIGFGIVQTIISRRKAESEGENEEKGEALKPEDNENVPVAQNIASPLVEAIKREMALFLAAVVKQKLMEFLERVDRLADDTPNSTDEVINESAGEEEE